MGSFFIIEQASRFSFDNTTRLRLRELNPCENLQIYLGNYTLKTISWFENYCYREVIYRLETYIFASTFVGVQWEGYFLRIETGKEKKAISPRGKSPFYLK